MKLKTKVLVAAISFTLLYALCSDAMQAPQQGLITPEQTSKLQELRQSMVNFLASHHSYTSPEQFVDKYLKALEGLREYGEYLQGTIQKEDLLNKLKEKATVTIPAPIEELIAPVMEPEIEIPEEAPIAPEAEPELEAPDIPEFEVPGDLPEMPVEEMPEEEVPGPPTE